MVDHPHYRYATDTRPRLKLTREYLKNYYWVDWDKRDGIKKDNDMPYLRRKILPPTSK